MRERGRNLLVLFRVFVGTILKRASSSSCFFFLSGFIFCFSGRERDVLLVLLSVCYLLPKLLKQKLATVDLVIC